MNKILLVLDHKNMFRGHLPGIITLDVLDVQKRFEKKGYCVEITNYNEIQKEGIEKFKNYFIIYTSSQLIDYKMYLDDILYILNEKNILIPKYEFFKAHENKGMQELLKRRYGIFNNYGLIYSSVYDINMDKDNFKYPLVVKTVRGAGSRGVSKIDDFDDFCKLYEENSFSYFSKLGKIKKKIKKKINFHFDEIWYERKRRNSYVVLQKLIPELDGDWKILIFDKKYYVLHRGLKKGDFRASGSGKLDFEVVPDNEILNFAKDIYGKFNVPVLSLDLAIDKDKNVYLIEFQALQFGPLTLIDSNGYYEYNKNKWKKIINKSTLEKEYVSAYDSFIRRNYG